MDHRLSPRIYVFKGSVMYFQAKLVGLYTPGKRGGEQARA